METQPQPQEAPKTGLWTHAAKWMIAVPMFASLMAFVTTKDFFGNSIWEALRATGESAAS